MLVQRLLAGDTVEVHLLHRHRSGNYESSSLRWTDGQLVMVFGARANLDAALTLTAALAQDSAAAKFADGTVTMSLAFHSVELFLKGAILTAQPNESFKGEGHDIEQLERRYRNLYPSKPFRFDRPFRRQAA
jgi:hypothetical protein